MGTLRVLLAFIGLVMLTYSLFTIHHHGWNLFPIFVESIRSMGWPGQFNLDLLTYLILSGLWIAWRHQFSVMGILLGLAASIIGMLFFAPYLLVISLYGKGDINELLLGANKTGQ